MEHSISFLDNIDVLIGRRCHRHWPLDQKARIVGAANPVDFRKGHDGLAAQVQIELRKEPFTWIVFVLRSKRANRLKLLYSDCAGLVITYNRRDAASCSKSHHRRRDRFRAISCPLSQPKHWQSLGGTDGFSGSTRAGRDAGFPLA